MIYRMHKLCMFRPSLVIVKIERASFPENRGTRSRRSRDFRVSRMKFSSPDPSLSRKRVSIVRGGQSRRRTRSGNERVKFRRHLGAGAPVLFPTATAGSIYGDVAERGGPWSASYAFAAASTATAAAAAVVVILVIVVKSSSPPPRLGSRNFRLTRDRPKAPRRGQYLSRANYARACYRALYIPETLAGRPCIYLRIEIYRGRAAGRLAGRRAGERAGAFRSLRSGIPVLHARIAPSGDELESSSTGTSADRVGGKDGRADHGNFLSPSSSSTSTSSSLSSGR